jgi:hypothetical protein
MAGAFQSFPTVVKMRLPSRANRPPKAVDDETSIVSLNHKFVVGDSRPSERIEA